MRKEPILTALDASGQLVHIDKAPSGERYMGAGQDHQDCKLYPVWRKKKRSSFVHLPGRRRVAAHRRGQSPVHRQACSSWHKFLQKLLSECGVCRSNGLQDVDHICPAKDRRGELMFQEGAPMFGKIAWVCHRCLRVHIWDLFAENATRVLREKQAPGLSVRPDITILDRNDRPIAFVEFHASHLSDESKIIAEQECIPLFVVDVERTLEEFQVGLQNPRRGMWQAVAEGLRLPLSDSELADHRRVDEMNYCYTESIAKEGGVSGRFSAIPDRVGNLADVVFHVAGRSPALPMPSIGHHLLASWSNLKCESQKRWLP